MTKKIIIAIPPQKKQAYQKRKLHMYYYKIART